MKRHVRALVAVSLATSSLAIAACGVLQSEASSAPSTHTYYIAADEVVWDYAASGMNRITGEPFGEEEAFWVESGPHRIGKVYKKALYAGVHRRVVHDPQAAPSRVGTPRYSRAAAPRRGG